MYAPSLAVAYLVATATATGVDPGPTPTRLSSDIAKRQDILARATTSYYSLVTTQIPKDEYSIGMGKNGTMGNSYWVYCIDAPFTTISSYGGCGRGDLYTRCSGKTAVALDDRQILCDVECVTHKVYKDLDVTTWTPFIGCGRGTSTMNLLRTSTHSSSEGTTVPTEDPNPDQTSEPPLPPDPPSDSGLSTGAIAGIAVGSVLGVLLLIGVSGVLIRRRYRNRGSPTEQASKSATGGQMASSPTEKQNTSNQLDSRAVHEMP